jgi:hypothetical protein
MKFGQPILSSELSGSLAGVVASSSRGGTNYFRVRATPGNPRSFAQSTMRLILTGISAAWASILTDPQRSDWAALAPSNSSGIDAFNKVNAHQLLGGLARLDDAPATLAFATAPYGSVSVDASAHSVVLPALAAAPNDASVNVFISKPQRSSRLSQQFGFTYAGTLADVQTGGSVVMNSQHPAYNLTAGDIVYVRLVQFEGDADATPGPVATEQDFRVVVVA